MLSDPDLQLDGVDKHNAELLKKRRFNHRVRPREIRPIYTLLGKPVATPGNLVSIASAVKTGKSAVVGAICAAAMAVKDGADLLGFGSSNPPLKLSGARRRLEVWVEKGVVAKNDSGFYVITTC